MRCIELDVYNIFNSSDNCAVCADHHSGTRRVTINLDRIEALNEHHGRLANAPAPQDPYEPVTLRQDFTEIETQGCAFLTKTSYTDIRKAMVEGYDAPYFFKSFSEIKS